MSIIYLVQSATDLAGANGYSSGLLEAGHPKILVSFIDYMDRHQSLHKPKANGKAIPKRAPTLGVKRRMNVKK